MRRFRGSIAPASLKRGLTAVAGVLAGAFPGLYCPGLIEAGLYGEADKQGQAGFRGSIAPASLKPLAPIVGGAGGDVSGALLPRPH